MENESKIETHQQVMPKENQIFLHYNKYNVDYIVEINPIPDSAQIELTFNFAKEVELTEEQKNEIALETRQELLKAFSPREIIDSEIEGL